MSDRFGGMGRRMGRGMRGASPNIRPNGPPPSGRPSGPPPGSDDMEVRRGAAAMRNAAPGANREGMPMQRPDVPTVAMKKGGLCKGMGAAKRGGKFRK